MCDIVSKCVILRRFYLLIIWLVRQLMLLWPAEAEPGLREERERKRKTGCCLCYLQGLTCVTYKERKGTQGNNKQRGQRGNVDTTGTWTMGDSARSKVPTPGSRFQGGTYVRNATLPFSVKNFQFFKTYGFVNPPSFLEVLDQLCQTFTD